MELTWGKRVAATDAWAGALDGAVLEPDARLVTHLVVKRGLLFSRRYTVPMDAVDLCGPEALYLSLPITEVIILPRAGTPAAGGTEPVGPRTDVLAADGAMLRLRGLRISEQIHSVTHLILRPRQRGLGELVAPAEAVAEIESSRITLGLSREDLAGLPAYRADPYINGDVWAALYATEDVSEVDVKGIRVDVADGVVNLEGNVRSPQAAQGIERIAGSVKGVAQIDNRLVTDREIDLAAASYIVAEAPQLAERVRVQSHLGTVTLTGYVPSKHLIEPLARGVRSLPGVLGLEDELEIRPPATVEEGPGPSAEEADGPTGSAP